MILPNKYVPISDSIIGISALILEILGNNNMTIDELWEKFNNNIKQNKKIKNTPSYNKFVLSIIFMYITNMINYSKKGVIYNENIKSKNL